MKKIKEVDLNSLKNTFELMDNDKGKIGLTLLDELIFMKLTLDELKKKVQEDGVVTEMCQGKYNIERANPALNQYNSLIKNYQSGIKQLTDLLSTTTKSSEDEFDDFNK